LALRNGLFFTSFGFVFVVGSCGAFAGFAWFDEGAELGVVVSFFLGPFTGFGEGWDLIEEPPAFV